jgi:hypothetical protein
MSSYLFLQYPKELGYDFLNVLIAFFTANRYIFILILTLIIYTLVFISFKRYMSNYPFALMLFMALWFFFTFTYLRQALAVSISWLAIRYIRDRKLWKFLLIVLISILFHNSAVVLIPFYFLPVRKYKIHNVLIVMVICLILGASGVTSSLYSMFGDITETSLRTEKYSVEGEFRIAYFIEAVFFLFFILTNYRRIPSDRTRLVLTNMALAFCAILLFFIKSENGGRLSWFFMIGLISTLTYILTQNAVRDKMKILILLGVSFFLYLRIVYTWNYMIYPYKTFFTNGVRSEDPIYDDNEYDMNYAKDKFYR